MKGKVRYKVTYKYTGSVTVDVEAADAEEAERAGLEEADEMIRVNLTVADVKVRELQA